MNILIKLRAHRETNLSMDLIHTEISAIVNRESYASLGKFMISRPKMSLTFLQK